MSVPSNNTGSNSGISVHMGFPNPAVDKSFDSLDLHQLLVQHPISTFFMRIEGDHWEEQGIFAGDIAIVDRALTPRKTDLLIWWQDDNFRIGRASRLPNDCQEWAVVTTIIHRFRHD